MKNFVRAFVVALVLTGAAASTSARTASASVTTIASSVQSNALPVPTCPPDGSKGTCGMQ
jgi:hypothetical protein